MTSLSQIPDITPTSNFEFNSWIDNSRRLLCDWCNVNTDLYALVTKKDSAREVICATCIEKLNPAVGDNYAPVDKP